MQQADRERHRGTDRSTFRRREHLAIDSSDDRDRNGGGGYDGEIRGEQKQAEDCQQYRTDGAERTQQPADGAADKQDQPRRPRPERTLRLCDFDDRHWWREMGLAPHDHGNRDQIERRCQQSRHQGGLE
ncbi:hypothetical protein D9M72_402310 [compost metagenome]